MEGPVIRKAGRGDELDRDCGLHLGQILHPIEDILDRVDASVSGKSTKDRESVKRTGIHPRFSECRSLIRR